MQDEIPWPPKHKIFPLINLKFQRGLKRFSMFFILVATKKELNPRTPRFRFSLVQDLIYNVSEGRVKIPKSISFPCTIKNLTNNTELVNVVNRLGHGVSYIAPMELFVENAYKIYEEKFERSLVLPRDVLKEEFTIYVADIDRLMNIDRLEETLSVIL